MSEPPEGVAAEIWRALEPYWGCESEAPWEAPTPARVARWARVSAELSRRSEEIEALKERVRELEDARDE